jgi:Uma2 family endonuclease
VDASLLTVAQPDQGAVDLAEVPKGYELVDGHLVELNVGAKSGWVGGRLFALLLAHSDKHGLGHVFPGETAYRCFPNRKTVRKPDASFIRRGRLKDEEIPDGEIKIHPDLAVESVSPNDLVYELDDKVEEYLAVGVRLVWVINPRTRIVIVHRADGSLVKLREGQDLDGEDVVVGFRCPLAAFLVPAKQETNGQQG